MSGNYNKQLKRYSQKLRREMTPQERHLWYDFLRNLPICVKRQQIIGDYIVDFYCAERKTIIEIDGSQHYEEQKMKSDKTRDDYLRARGFMVLRYADNEINCYFDRVCNDILVKLELI